MVQFLSALVGIIFSEEF